jgi:hypothetical protein
MQTQIVTEEALLSLLKRFSSFHDSVVESWAIDWVEDSSSATRAKAQIRVRDYENYEEESDEVWQQVVLIMENCDLFRLTNSNRAYYRVTANGIYILMEQNENTVFGIDFGHFNDTPTSISQLMESPCCVVCSRLSWDIL